MIELTPFCSTEPLYFDGELRAGLAERFAAEAMRRNKSPAELATDLLQTIIEDNLFAAVLDD